MAWVIVALSAVLPAYAQDEPTRYPPARRALSIGGEFTAIAGPRDTDAFFNYTEYERNALRLARIRLLVDLRLAASLSVVGEVRTENGADLEIAALYARWRPSAAHDFAVQAGRIPPVLGAFARRAYGRDNAVIGFPLAYQYLTSLRPDAIPSVTDDVLRMRARGWLSSFPIGSRVEAAGVSLLSASRWDTGIEATWRRGWLELAGALTRGAPATPVITETNDGKLWSGRAAFHLPFGLSIAASAGRGQWIDDAVLAGVTPSRRAESTQTIVAADAEYGAGRWLVRGEWVQSTFETPFPAMAASVPLPAWSAFAEIRYRLHPRWQLGSRIERLRFASIASVSGVVSPWDAPVDRVEAVVGFRVTRRIDVKAGWQGDWRDGGRVRSRGFPIAQFLAWF